MTTLRLPVASLARPRGPVEAARRALLAEGVLASGADASLQFLPMCLVALGATSVQVGALATVTGFAGALALGPAAWLARRAGARRRVVLAATGGGRLLLLAMAGAALAGRGGAIGLVIAFGGLRALSAALAQPSWTATFAAVVPIEGRAQYVSRRALATGLTSMAVVPLAGWLVGRGGAMNYAWLFGAAALLGAAGCLAFARVEAPAEPAPAHAAHRTSVWRDGVLWRFLVALGCLHAMAALAGPFFVVHAVRALHASPMQIGMLVTADAAAGVVGQALAVWLVARVPSRQLFAASGVAIALVPVLWIAIDAPWEALLPTAVSGAAWAICHVAVFNLLLEYAPADRVSEYASVQQAAVMVATFVGPLAGSVLVAQLPLTALFGISALGRLVAVPLFLLPVPALVALASRVLGGHSLLDGLRRVP